MLRWVILIPLFSIETLFAQKPDFSTFYEKSGKTRTPTYQETIEYCQLLDKESKQLNFLSFGVSPQGRTLPLLIFDKQGFTEPDKIRKAGRIVVLIQACIHAGEPDGKDAGLLLLKDIITKKIQSPFLDNISLLFIPIFNVDGHERFGPYNRINQNGPTEMGWRTTAQNLNLNRDYLKADAPEMKQWLTLFQKWLPDFVIDCHTTDGADYQYQLTYGLEIYGNLDKDITTWLTENYITSFTNKLSTHGIKSFPYVSFRNWHDPRSGLITQVSPPMLSGGYCAIQNRPCLLIETHMLKDYQTRVNATYFAILNTLEIISDQKQNFKLLLKNADEKTSSGFYSDNPLPLKFKNTTDSTIVVFEGVEYSSVKSDLSGGEWFTYSSVPQNYLIPYFNHLQSSETVILPEAYIIPPEWTSVIERLSLHGIKFWKTKKDTVLQIQSYSFVDPRFRDRSFEGRQTVSCKKIEVVENRLFPKGSVVVETHQRSARVIAHILEPSGPDSYLYWGFFNAIFEQKEYAESYVMEPLARKMLSEDLELKLAFEKEKAENPELFKDPFQVLNWFYKRTPWWDEKWNKYPIGKLTNLVNVLNLK